MVQQCTVSQKKVPTFKLSVTLSNLNQFKNFCTTEKCIKIATKPIRHYPSHLRQVATLPCKIKNSNFLQIFSRYGRKCKRIAFLSPLTLLFIHKFRYFLCLKRWVFPHIDCKSNFSCHCSFTRLLLWCICGIGNSSQQTLLCLSTVNMVFSDEDKILINTHKYCQHTLLQVQRNWNRCT